MATWVQLCCLIQSTNCNRNTVLVENVLISFPSGVKIQAVILSLWTSIPHALSLTTSIENILSTAHNNIGGWCSNQNRINLPCVLPVRERQSVVHRGRWSQT